MKIAPNIRKDIDNEPDEVPKDPSLYGFFDSGDNYSHSSQEGHWLKDPENDLEEAQRRIQKHIDQKKELK